MSFIALGNVNISNMMLGDAQVSAVWLGNIRIWPTDIREWDDRLLGERGFGFRGVVGGDSSSEEKVIQIDRYINSLPVRTDVGSIKNEQDTDILYEAPNNLTKEIGIGRDHRETNEERDTTFVNLDYKSDDTSTTIDYESLQNRPDDPLLGIATD